MKKKWLLILICLVPLFVFMNVYQVFRYRQVKTEIGFLEAEQQDLLENNKRIIAGIGVLQSPGRIDELAGKELDLKKTVTEGTLRIIVPAGEGEGNE
ncbi:MAG: hypothetical protein E4H36_02845 [Spirochaetales bacterium]|nr:MAG: hypothetical protein E4H36_02845 [Spirochaetales bacterium]